MTETIAHRIKDIAREIRWQGGGDDDTTRGATFSILYDIGEEVAALTAERDSLRAEVTRLREAQFKAAKDLKRMVRDWRAHAAGRYCSIYNPEMGKGLRNAAGNLEEYINNQIQGEQGQ